jgi:hypothetical protein
MRKGSIGGLFGAGVPTAIDVDRIISELGVPEPGEVIKYKALEYLLGIKRDQNRFKSVVTAWRRRMERLHNLLFTAVVNEGYQCLSSSGRVTVASGLYKHALRRVGRAATVAAKTDRTGLTEDEKRACDHVQNTGAQLRLAAATAARQIDWEGDETEEGA